MALLERDLESCNLPLVVFLGFNGKPSHWSEFIQCFKEETHMKRRSLDSLTTEPLLSVFVFLKGLTSCINNKVSLVFSRIQF